MIAIVDGVVMIVRGSVSGSEAYKGGKRGRPVTKVLTRIAWCIVPCITLYEHRTAIRAAVGIHIMLCIVLCIALYAHRTAYRAAVRISCCVLCRVSRCMCIVLPIVLLYAY